MSGTFEDKEKCREGLEHAKLDHGFLANEKSIKLIVNGVEFKMIPVHGGTFTMGATSEQGIYAYGWESPTHSVTLSDYYIGETEVTQALWEAVMGKSVTQIANGNGWKTCGVGGNYPMYDVNWDDCQKFIRRLNQLTGRTFRLPTEAEWEYAARGGNKSRGYKYSGSNYIDEVAWYEANSEHITHMVKTKKPNELGIYDMSGNVWEWCQDWYGDYTSNAQINPKGPNNGSCRVNRGGDMIYTEQCRVACRNYSCPDVREDFIGFRLVLVP